VSGVVTVVGGWFMTALIAFTISALFAIVLFYGKIYGAIPLLIIAAVMITKNHFLHKERAKSSEEDKIFNLKKVSDFSETLDTTFEHIGYLLREIRVSLNNTLDGLFKQNLYILGKEKAKTKKIQHWSNTIIANIFKSMRLLQKEGKEVTYNYGQTIRRIQKLADGHRDIIMRSHSHVNNQHKGLLDVQVKELTRVKEILNDIFLEVERAISQRRPNGVRKTLESSQELRMLAKRLHEDQLQRINDRSSKTRLSILFYSIIGNAMMLSKQNIKLLEIFKETFGSVDQAADFDLD
jgi:hypothetical protein